MPLLPIQSGGTNKCFQHSYNPSRQLGSMQRGALITKPDQKKEIQYKLKVIGVNLNALNLIPYFSFSHVRYYDYFMKNKNKKFNKIGKKNWVYG